MAKIDETLEQVSAGFNNPAVNFYTVMVEDQHMEAMKVRRKVSNVTQHKLVCLTIGEMGQQNPTAFYGHKLSDCVKKALEWRQLPTKSKRGPRNKNGQPQQAPQG